MRFGLDGIPLNQIKAGVGHYTYELGRALAVVAPEHEFQFVSPNTSELSHHEQNLPSNLHFSYRSVLHPRLWWTLQLPLYIKRRSLDLFHGTNFYVPLLKSCPTVLTIHDLSLLLHPSVHEHQLVEKARRNLPLMVRRADAIITPSEAIKREVVDVLRVSPDNVFAIPEAPRAEFQPMPLVETQSVYRALGIPDEFMLFVGTLEPRKNLLNLFRALDEILTSSHSLPHLVVAGKRGWLMDETFSFLEASGIRDRVVFTGHLADEQLRALYSSCQFFIYPSLYEGFGLPLLEAMACGAPVLTSRVPSIAETVGEAARLISPTDVRDLAAGIVELLNNPEERRFRSEAGLQHARKFSWGQTASATFELYKDVLERPTKVSA